MERLRAAFQARCAAEEDDEAHAIAAALGLDDPDALWTQVQTNLQAGKIRLVFVADVIPPELQRVVEFLNKQMTPAEVLAVEIRQFLGEGLRTLVPRVLGINVATKPTTPSVGRQWDADSFFADIRARRPAEEVVAVQQIYAWMQAHCDALWWGRGKYDGSCYATMQYENRQCSLLAIWSSGHVEVPFQYMTAGPFTDTALRLQLLERLNAIPGFDLAPSKINGSPYLRLGIFTDASIRNSFLTVMEWAYDVMRSAR